MAKRRIQKALVKFISLCPRGANGLTTMFKADDDDHFEARLLVKDMTEEGVLTAVVYAPETRDAQGDIASAEVIKDAMYESARNGVQLDMRHDGKEIGKDKAFIAESFIIQKNDPRFKGMTDYEGNPVDVTGAWSVVLKIDDPDLRQRYRDGDWDGVSMGGTMLVTQEKSDTEIAVADALAKLLNPNTGDNDMTPEQITEALKANNEALTTSIVAGLKEVLAPPAPDEDKAKKDQPETAPAFKGDPTKPDDVAAHQKALEAFNLRKDVDWNDPDSVKQYHEALSKSETKPKKSDREIELEAELAKERGRSNQADPDADANKDDGMTGSVIVNFEKTDTEALQSGSRMAAYINGTSK